MPRRMELVHLLDQLDPDAPLAERHLWLIEALRSALRTDGDALLTSEELSAVELGISRLENAATGADHDVIRTYINELSQATEAFAARRMNKSVAAALTGRKLEELSSP